MVSFSIPAFASEKTVENEYKITQNVFEYPNSKTPLMQEHTRQLQDQLVDPGKAMGLSALYFGLGQIYSGDKEKGAWLMAGGTVLTVGIFALFLPRFASRNQTSSTTFQDGARSTASALAFITFGGVYIWNIRDAYETAVKKNTDVRSQMLFGNNLDQLEKIGFSSTDNGIALNYNISKF